MQQRSYIYIYKTKLKKYERETKYYKIHPKKKKEEQEEQEIICENHFFETMYTIRLANKR